MLLVNPPVKRIDLHFPLGLEVTARNSKGVTIKDALDAIHKQFKKKVHTPPASFPPRTPSHPSSTIPPHRRYQITNTPQADDELDNPYLAGFEWDKEECWTRLIVHQTNVSTIPKEPSSKKSKKKNKDEA
jgi:hypothetical protein